MKKTLSILPLLLCLYTSAQQTAATLRVVEIPGSGYRFESPLTNLPVNNLIWDEAEPFINGFSRVLKANTFLFVNANGVPVSKTGFEAARNFSNHLAAVRLNGKWGFVNESGLITVPCKYEIVFDFTEEVTVVLENKSWKLINNKGLLIKPLDIDVCYGFKDGVAKIEKNNRIGTMNSLGNIQMTGEPVAASAQRNSLPIINNAATACPENIDFEDGSFLNWNCFTGDVDSLGTTNVITVNPSAPINNRHRIITRAIPSAIDPFGLFPTNPPDGSNHAVRLGNTNIGAQAERIQYKIRVPLNDSNFSIKYNYAVVFEDPGHTTWTQPRFIARLFDSAANAYVSCASFEYISTSNLPGFEVSTVDTTVIFKPWSSVFISLRGYSGKTMYLEFTTADCVRRGHWGYAYVDIENSCGQSISMQYDCNFPNIATLNAPPGFQTYNWWNQNFTTNLGSGQQIVLNPGPTVNSTIWVELIPFNDFGCRDTMPVTITGSFNPEFEASDTIAICAPHRITFYNRSLPSQSAIWDFGDGTTATGDVVTHTFNLPGTYIVTLTVTLPSGCVGIKQQTVRIIQPTGSFNFTGGSYCNSQTIQFDAITRNVDSLVWDFGDGTILTTTQTTVFHTYATPGIYIPSVTFQSNAGCSFVFPGPDTIRIESLQAAFDVRETRSCNSTVINFTDQSQSLFGISNYAWDYGDGNTGSGSNSTHTYTTAGIYPVQLIITGTTGCKDTITIAVNVALNELPVALITGPQQACMNTQVTFNSTVQSSDNIASIEWLSSNGNSGSGNDFTITFDQPGNYQIQLIATTINGCADTTSFPFIVKPSPVISNTGNQTVCNGVQTNPITFNSSLPNTNFNWTNDFPAIGLPASGTGDIPAFTGTNSGSAATIANILVTPVTNGCSGNSASFTITINPTPTVFQPADQTVCNGSTTSGIMFTNFTSSLNAAVNFTWVNDQPSIGLAASGSGNIFPFTAINNSSNPITATITITPSENGCTGLPLSFTITVYPTPDVDQPAHQEICNGSVSTLVNFTGNAAGAVFNWTNDLPSIGLAASGTGNLPVFTAVNNSNAPISANISVTPSTNGCDGIIKYFIITVNPTPSVTQPADQTVCNGSTTNATIFSGPVNNTVYSWTNNLSSIGLPASGSGDIPAFNPVNNDLTTVTATITVTPSINICTGIPKDYTITVMPRANVMQPLNQFLCNGQITPMISFTGPLNGTVYNWTNSDTAIGLIASGTGSIPSFTAINNGNAAIASTITVTATANNCPGNSKTFTITVDPTPDMAQPADQVLCDGTTTAAINFTGSVSGTQFSWINSAPEIGLPANGTGDIASFIATNNNNYPITAIISVVGTANSCNSVTRVFTITVNPSPDIDPLFDQAVCDGLVTNRVELTGPVLGTVYNWTNNRPSIGLAASGVGDIPSFTAINDAASPVVATITVYGNTANSCRPAIKTFKITVNPTPAVVASNDNTICKGSNTQLTVSGARDYSWSPATGLSCTDCSNPLAAPGDTTTYIVEGTSRYGCISYDTVKLNVIQPFDMIVSPNDTICTGRTARLKAMKASRYLWSPAISLNDASIADPVATPTTSTAYQVIGYDEHHCFTDTGYVNITVGPTPLLNIGPDITTTTGSTITLNPVTQNGPIRTWSWSPSSNLSCNNCPNPTATVSNNTSFILAVENNYGCIVSDTIQIIVFCKSSQVFVPNAFTPDGDGLNDILMIRGTGVTVKSFRVFNRWGVLVFEKQNFSANDARYGWDGKIRGVPATPDVYVYTTEVTCDNGTTYMFKGNTTILK